MPITHTNRKNVTYTLYRCTTKTGKLRHYFARQSAKGTPCQAIPDGYEVSETPNGRVSIVKSRPKRVRQSEADMIQRILDNEHPSPSKYRIFVRHNCIDIYERVDSGADNLIDMFRQRGLGFAVDRREFREWCDSRARFEAVMRFTLLDEETRMYQAQQMYYLGSIKDWINVGEVDGLEVLARDMIGRLGTESFSELY